MTWSELIPWPLPPRVRKPNLLPGETPEQAELRTAQVELHQAASARHYLGNRPQRTTEQIAVANAAIAEARQRVADAKAVLRNAPEPKE